MKFASKLANPTSSHVRAALGLVAKWHQGSVGRVKMFLKFLHVHDPSLCNDVRSLHIKYTAFNGVEVDGSERYFHRRLVSLTPIEYVETQ